MLGLSIALVRWDLWRFYLLHERGFQVLQRPWQWLQGLRGPLVIHPARLHSHQDRDWPDGQSNEQEPQRAAASRDPHEKAAGTHGEEAEHDAPGAQRLAAPITPRPLGRSQYEEQQG